jgi:predicted negative regulator of RcsB-dependent stress response
VARITRKQLKSDKVAEEIKHTRQFLSAHPDEVKRYSAIAAAVLVVAAGIFFYTRYQDNTRRAALEQALRLDDGVIGPQQNVVIGQVSFPNQEAKDKALKEAFANLGAKYRGTQEGAIAQLYLGAATADKGDLQAAERLYKEAADSAPAAYASVAKMSLAQIYASNGQTAEAEKLLRGLMDKPTVFVSKEEATIVLAQLLLHSNPLEARKLLEPLRNSRTSVSSKAIATLGLIPATINN